MIPTSHNESNPSSYVRQKRIVELSAILGAFIFIPKILTFFGAPNSPGDQASAIALIQSAWNLVFVILILTLSSPAFLRRPHIWRFNPRVLFTALGVTFSLVAISVISGAASQAAGLGKAPGWFPFSTEFSLLSITAAVLRLCIGALFEELLYRVYIFERLRSLGVPAPVFSILSVALFAWGHNYEGTIGLISSAVLGAVFGFAWLQWKSIWINSISHLLYNLLVYAIAIVAARAVSI